MYPHFIEINNTDLGGKNIVNIDSIAYVCGDDEAQIILNIADREDNTIDCSESYDDVKKLIENSGCLIQMGDPRLDNKPLTMDDLRNMIGEPVWSPNAKCWCLVYDDCSDDPKNLKLVNRHGLIIGVTEKELIKFPMYRMKVTDEKH